MRRPRRSAPGRGALGLVLIALALVVLGGLAAAAFMLRPPPTDPGTLCRTDQPVASHTIVLVDATDKLEPRHRRKLRAVLMQERARLSQFDRLTVMRLNVRNPREPSVLFSKCLPRPPEQTNPLFENARMIQQQWDDEFEHALDVALRSAASSGAGRSSPILDSVRAIAADPDFGVEIPHRRLVLVSDLLENEPGGFSLYAPTAAYAEWRAHDAFGPPDLSGVHLRIAPLDRPEFATQQANALNVFWPAYFDAAKIDSLETDPQP
jgi:hypothetical protein